MIFIKSSSVFAFETSSFLSPPVCLRHVLNLRNVQTFKHTVGQCLPPWMGYCLMFSSLWAFKGFIVSCGETTFFVDVWLGCKFLFYVSMGRRGDAKRVNNCNVEMSPVARREGAGRKREWGQRQERDSRPWSKVDRFALFYLSKLSWQMTLLW